MRNNDICLEHHHWKWLLFVVHVISQIAIYGVWCLSLVSVRLELFILVCWIKIIIIHNNNNNSNYNRASTALQFEPLTKYTNCNCVIRLNLLAWQIISCKLTISSTNNVLSLLWMIHWKLNFFLHNTWSGSRWSRIFYCLSTGIIVCALESILSWCYNFINTMSLHRPQKAIWHGSSEKGKHLHDKSCESWRAGDMAITGQASFLYSGLLNQQTRSCANQFIVLCIETNPDHNTMEEIKRAQNRHRRWHYRF